MFKKLTIAIALMINISVMAQVSSNGLFAYYTFDGNANDISGNGNNGTISGNVFYTTDRNSQINSALSISGVANTGNISIPTVPTSAFTFSFWVKKNGQGIKQDVIVSNNDLGIALYFNTNNKLYLNKTNNSASSISNFVLTNSGWNHIVVTYENNIVKFYLNSTIDKQEALNFNFTNTGLYSINERPNAKNPFNGLLDDFRIYNRAVDACEVLSLFSNTFLGISTPTLDFSNNILTSSISTIPGISYSWLYNGNVVTNANSSTFTGTLNTGTYIGISSIGACASNSFPFVLTAQIANIQTGLVAYYPFNGNANDESGNGNNGNAINGASLNNDRFLRSMNAFSFNGINSAVTVPGAGLNFVQNISISFWVKPSSLQNNTAGIIDKSHSTPGGTNWVIEQNGLSTNQYYFAQNTNIVTSQFFIAPNVWSYFTITKNNSLVKAYLNNILMGTFTGATDNPDNKPLIIGAQNSNSTGISLYRFFQGNIDDIRIYNRALNTSEINTLYTEYCDTYFAQNPIISYTNGGLSVNTYGGANYQWAVNSLVQPTQTMSGFSGSLTNGLYTVTVTNVACKAFATYQLNQYKVGTILPQNNCSTLPFIVPIEIPSTISSGIIGMDIEMNFNSAIMTPTGIAYLGSVVTNTGVGLVDVSTIGNILHLNISYDGAGEFSGSGLIVAPEFTLFQPLAVGTYTVGGGNVKESYLISERDVELTSGTFSVINYLPSVTGKVFFWNNPSNPITNNANTMSGTFLASSLQNCIPTGKTSGSDSNGEFKVEMTNINYGISASRDIPTNTPVVEHLNAFDNVLVTKIRNGQLANPTIYQLIAADVNGSGAITSGDRTLLRRRTLMQITSFPNNVPDWKFFNYTSTFSGFNKNNVPSVLTCIPVTTVLTNGCTSIENISLTGVLVGDVDGSYLSTPNGVNLRLENITHTEIDYFNATTDAKGITSIPVKVYHDSQVEGFDLTFNFDPLKYEVVSVMLNESINVNKTESVGYNIPFAGYLIATVDNHLGLNINPYLLSVNIKKLNQNFVASDLGTPKSYINGKAARTEIVTNTNSVAEQKETSLFHLYPNPTSGNFIIETSKVGQNVEIFDILGKSVLSISNLNSTKTEIYLPSKGVYFVKVGNKVQKLIVK